MTDRADGEYEIAPGVVEVGADGIPAVNDVCHAHAASQEFLGRKLMTIAHRTAARRNVAEVECRAECDDHYR